MSLSNDDSILAVEKVNIFHGDVQAIWDVSFKVRKGEIVTIVGSNGAGKTTTLETIAGLLKPSSGSIFFDGKRIDNLAPHQIVAKGCTLTPEGRHLFPNMTIIENLEMGCYVAEARKQKGDTLKWVFGLFPQLANRKKQLAGTMSGGEQQMLAVGRALMSRPKLLMLDEPSFGLAPKYVSKLSEIVTTINKDGVTVLLVEQNTRLALKTSNRGYVLESGKIALEGSSAELMENHLVKKAYLGLPR